MAGQGDTSAAGMQLQQRQQSHQDLQQCGADNLPVVGQQGGRKEVPQTALELPLKVSIRRVVSGRMDDFSTTLHVCLSGLAASQ